jgi:hypothetical protein
MVSTAHPGRTSILLVLLALLAAAACIAIPASQLLGTRPFTWAMAQPAAWQGGIEALLLIILFGAGLAIGARWAWLVLVALPLAFYLRRHGVDAPLLLDLLYLEIVIGLGALLQRMFRLPPPHDMRGYLQAFVLGFVLWSLLAWTASASDAGSIRTLAWLTLLLSIPAAFGRHAPLLLHLARSLRGQPASDRFWHGALAAWIAVLYARSNVVSGYDSLWYGLRPEQVLVPGGSVFEPLGLVSPVYYFPKLYEVFLLPMSGFGDYSTMSGMTLLMMALVLLACAVLAQRIGLPERARLPVLAVIATLPALANSAVSPKPDVLSILFVLLAADAALAFVRSRRGADFAWLAACGILACLAKLTAIPYVGALGLATLVAAWHERAKPAPGTRDPYALRLAATAAAGALVLAGFVTARTWLLTGMPTIGPDPLFRLWGAFGMALKEPVGTLEWTYPQVWSDLPKLVIDWLFRPQHLRHIVISWTGNVWLWCSLLALAGTLAAARAGRRDHSRWPLAALMLTGAALALGIRYHVRGSDGNYFLAALLPAILVSATAAFTRLATLPRVFALALACLPAFALFHASYSFLSAGWSPGTRAFDLDLLREWHDSRRERWQVLRHAGLERIGRYLNELPGAPRAVGYAAEPASFRLPARFEYLLPIGYSRPEYVDDRDRFLRFLREQGIEHLILPNDNVPEQQALVTPAVAEAAAELMADPRVQRIDDRAYRLLDLRGWQQASRHASSGSPGG